jgi:hypothetical protein
MDTENREAMSGWLTFAGVMLIVAGLFNFVDGLIAVADAAWFSRVTGRVVEPPIVQSLAAWGWVVMVLGLLATGAGIGVLFEATWARFTGVVLAGVNMLVQFGWLVHFPFWSLTMIAVDVIVIYALVAPSTRVRPQQIITLADNSQDRASVTASDAAPQDRTTRTGG